MKVGLLLMINVIKALAKSVLIPLVLTAVASAADSRIHKKILGSWATVTFGLGTTTVILLIKEMIYIMKIVTSLEDSGVLIKGVTRAIPNEAKEQRGGFLGVLLGTFRANLLRNMLAGKGAIRSGDRVRNAGEDFQVHFILWFILMLTKWAQKNLSVNLLTNNSTL